MDIQNNVKKIFVLSVLILITLFIFLNYNGKSTNQEAPKRATLVNHFVEDSIYYG